MMVTDITKDQKYNDLFDAANYELHLQYLKENVTGLRFYEALQITRFYGEWFKEHPTFATLWPLRFQTLKALIVDNQWVALSMLSDEETQELLRHHLVALFTLHERYTFPWDYTNFPDVTLDEQMRVNLLHIIDLEARDYYKSQLAIALQTNQEVITSAPFFSEVKQVPATTERWFKAYLSALGPQVSGSDFLLSEFLHKSEHGSALSTAERHRLELLFKLYHRLNTSSFTLEGFEDKLTFVSTDHAGVLQYGEFTPYDKETMQTITDLVKKTNSQGISPRPPITSISAKIDPNFDIAGLDIGTTKGPDHFTDEDSVEITEHSAKVSELGTQSNVNYQKIVADIKTEVALSFASPEDDKRFVDLVVSVLRGLRDTMELKQYLLDLSFPSAECDAVVATVEQHLNGGQPVKRATPVKDNLATKPTLQQLQKKLEQPTATTTMTQPQFGMQVEPPAKATPESTRKSFLPKLRRSRAVKRPLVDDVRLQPSMVMGPIDELRAMDTLEFRRLSPDPAQAARRMKDKIELLAEESITKQAEGIDAFKQSPINTLYLELGNESIASGKPVSVVIAERQANGTPSLSEAEFNAISDLNKQLRF